MNLRLKRTPGLYLVGFMASGKTTVGRHLAHRMGWNFFDTDNEIAAAEKMTIEQIFVLRGEDVFRQIESAMIEQHVRWIERGRPAVVALGGGAFMREANRDLMRGNGISIWLDCPFEKVDQRVRNAPNDPVRPLAADPVAFRERYDSRREHYALADIRVPVASDDPEETVAAILSDPIFK